jgi:Macrophage migration inhibitory factor (MIF)
MSQAMLFGGTDGPCASAILLSIGKLGTEENKKEGLSYLFVIFNSAEPDPMEGPATIHIQNVPSRNDPSPNDPSHNVPSRNDPVTKGPRTRNDPSLKVIHETTQVTKRPKSRNVPDHKMPFWNFLRHEKSSIL